MGQTSIIRSEIKIAITIASHVPHPRSCVPERSFSSCRFVSGRSQMI